VYGPFEFPLLTVILPSESENCVLTVNQKRPGDSQTYSAGKQQTHDFAGYSAFNGSSDPNATLISEFHDANATLMGDSHPRAVQDPNATLMADDNATLVGEGGSVALVNNSAKVFLSAFSIIFHLHSTWTILSKDSGLGSATPGDSTHEDDPFQRLLPHH